MATMAMLNNQRVYIYNYIVLYTHTGKGDELTGFQLINQAFLSNDPSSLGDSLGVP